MGRERGRVVATRLALEAASGAPALVSCHMDFCAKNLPKLVTLSTIKVMSNKQQSHNLSIEIISLNFIKIHIWWIDNSNDMEFAD